jgi:hypothetical protein
MRIEKIVNGPSPRAWGSATGLRTHVPGARSIPTCVGLGPRRRRRIPGGSVHPHVRGARGKRPAETEAVISPQPQARNDPLSHLSRPLWFAPREHLTDTGVLLWNTAPLEHRRSDPRLHRTRTRGAARPKPDRERRRGGRLRIRGPASSTRRGTGVNSHFPDFSETRQIRHSMLARPAPGANSPTFLSR